MSKPNLKINPGHVPIQIKTMFYTEGNPCGLLIENRGGSRTEKQMPFNDAQAALTWCQRNGSNLFYTATNIAHS